MSWGGGVILQFWGSGFNGTPVSNTIQLTAWIDGNTYVIEGTPMDGKSSPDGLAPCERAVIPLPESFV